MTVVSDFPPGEEVGDILDHFEQRVVVVVPGDLASGHRVTSDHPALQPPPCHRDGDYSDRGQASLARRSAQFDDHMEHWVRSLTRAGLVERALSVAGAGSEAGLVKLVPCLPSLAMLQVNKKNNIQNMPFLVPTGHSVKMRPYW